MKNKHISLRDRAKMLRSARAFFDERCLLEVDCPALTSAPPLDKHIDVMKVLLKEGTIGYLHTSAEYGMKRLLASGIGDIYQISHVFRDGEIGPLHNPEFTMVEWYRCGFSFEQMIEETLAFLHLFLGELPSKSLSYREMLQRYLGIDYTQENASTLLHLAQQRALPLSSDAPQWDKDTLLQLLITTLVEPQLEGDALHVITHFPASQAALAQTKILPEGENVALRFEIYFRGIELANGYHELTDPVEQQRRFAETNTARAMEGKEFLAIDEKFLNALRSGMPDCCGVAVGFDRLLLLRHGHRSLVNILPFSWSEA
jgi:elongation factor P--(R)-beta-lysine ligase